MSTIGNMSEEAIKKYIMRADRKAKERGFKKYEMPILQCWQDELIIKSCNQKVNTDKKVFSNEF